MSSLKKAIADSILLKLNDCIFFVAVILAVLMFVSIAECKLYEVTLVENFDGDSLRLKLSNDFEFDARLAGIDAPELAQNYGNTCQEILKTYANESNLRVQFVGEDSYNRKLVYLVRQDYSEINFDMIVAGCAWVYSPSRSRREKYKEAFKVAWTSRIGVFAFDTHCQPSKFRRGTCAE